jgi:hypothetical protein
LTPARLPLHHIVRVRRSEDLRYIRPGVMDEVLVNANQLENSPDSTSTAISQAGVPYSIDPVLTRFQVPAWWQNDRGEDKQNYRRLGAAYVRGTNIQLPAGPLVQTVPSDADWRILAANVLAYQVNRLNQIRPQLDLFHPEPELVRVTAPALAALSVAEDRVNRLLAEASAEVATLPLAVPVIVPLHRLLDADELDKVIAATPRNGVSTYMLWTPGATEERLLADHDAFAAVLRLISALAERGIPVGHLHAGYTVSALHDLGISAVVHSLGWLDKGEPLGERRGGLRSCQTYVPGVRHSLRFAEARALGRDLTEAEYIAWFCDCTLCVGAFEGGQHPLDILLEDHLVLFKDGRDRRTPTSRAVGLNTWHFLLSRRQEVASFSDRPAGDVLTADIERAASLAGGRESDRLRRLAAEVRSA